MAINSEQINLARSLLYAFAEFEDNENTASPVHFNKVSNKADFFSFDDNFLEHLKVLELIGEARQVKPNFWSITPTRSVKFEDKWIIVSSLNNVLLRDLIDLNETGTLGRFGDFCLENYPKQNLFSWMEIPRSLPDWIHDLKTAAMSVKNLKPTTQNPGDLEYYAPWLKTRKREWLEFKEIKESKDDLFLARARDTGFPRDYLWFKTDNSGNYQSYFDKEFLIQAMLGLRMMMGCREWDLHLTSLENGRFKLNWPQYFPGSLEKIVAATSISRSNDSKKTEYILEQEYVDIVATNLNHFGLILKKF